MLQIHDIFIRSLRVSVSRKSLQKYTGINKIDWKGENKEKKNKKIII